MEWWRSLPVPEYGNYGGMGRNIEPVDALDWTFWPHDMDFYKVELLLRRKKINKKYAKELRSKADHNLAVRLRQDMGDLSWKGRWYRRAAMLVFRPKKEYGKEIVPVVEEFAEIWQEKELKHLERIVRKLSA